MDTIVPDLPGAEYQAIIDASLDAIFIIHPDGRILNANMAAVRSYGYSVEELRQINVTELAATEIRDNVPERL